MSKKLRFNPLFIIWHVIRNDAHKLQYDPKTQWHYHINMSRYWVANFPIVFYLFFFQSRIWLAIALFLNTMYSLYANLATEFGAIPASYTAMVASGDAPPDNKKPEIAKEKPVQSQAAPSGVFAH